MKLTSILLPIYALVNLQNTKDSWNVVRNIIGKSQNNLEVIQQNNIPFLNNKSTNESILKVFYPKGSYSPSKKPVGGIGFFASPQTIFMANEVLFTYDVFFDPTFDPVLGGKLPGLFIGNGVKKENMIGASGGNHATTSSCRIVWRANLSAEAYVYLSESQHQDYYNIPKLVQNKIYGDSLWRGLFSFYKNTWNNVSIRLKTNTFTNNIPNYDGELEIKINNVVQSFNKLLWRTNESYNLNAIIFETFFGGSKPSTATPHDTWTYFKNVNITKIN
jgi:hypothetical protein